LNKCGGHVYVQRSNKMQFEALNSRRLRSDLDSFS
jgi:hypothetical protein